MTAITAGMAGYYTTRYEALVEVVRLCEEGVEITLRYAARSMDSEFWNLTELEQIRGGANYSLSMVQAADTLVHQMFHHLPEDEVFGEEAAERMRGAGDALTRCIEALTHATVAADVSVNAFEEQNGGALQASGVAAVDTLTNALSLIRFVLHGVREALRVLVRHRITELEAA